MKWIIQGGFFMIPLIICSIIGLAIIGERFTVYRRTMKFPLAHYDDAHLVVYGLRRRMVALNTIIVISPMLGLLGTVTGLMKCFNLLGKDFSLANPQEMSLGISEALITTAAGLVITVVATIFYNYFNTRLENYIFDYNNSLKEELSHVERTNQFQTATGATGGDH